MWRQRLRLFWKDFEIIFQRFIILCLFPFSRAAVIQLLGTYVLISPGCVLPRAFTHDVWFQLEMGSDSQEIHIHQANNTFIYRPGRRRGNSDTT